MQMIQNAWCHAEYLYFMYDGNEDVDAILDMVNKDAEVPNVDDTITFEGNENVNAIPDGVNAETEVSTWMMPSSCKNITFPKTAFLGLKQSISII